MDNDNKLITECEYIALARENMLLQSDVMIISKKLSAIENALLHAEDKAKESIDKVVAYENLIKDLEKIITDEINKCSAELFKLSDTPDTTKLYDLTYQRLDDFKDIHIRLSELHKKYLERG